MRVMPYAGVAAALPQSHVGYAVSLRLCMDQNKRDEPGAHAGVRAQMVGPASHHYSLMLPCCPTFSANV